MPNPDTDLVLKLQSLDTRISELDKEVADLPKHIAQIEKALESHLRRLESDRAALAANQKDRRKFEGDIQVQQQKISKLRDQMLQVKTNEQYRAFQNEITYCEEEIRKAEDRILDLMGESEPLEANLKKAETALAEEKKQVESEKQRARERTAVDQKQLDQLKSERKALVAQLKPELHSLYQRIRKKWRGSVIAEVQDGRCTGCNIALRPQFFQDVRKGDQVLQCESCGRIVYYNPPVDVEKDMAENPAVS
jgi:predicted  nucleic acid-binding Zn-ribbon protein